jgi:hypothetical protein
MKKYPRVERALSSVLVLYPKNFRDTYAEQIELTVQDMLSNRNYRSRTFAVCAFLVEIAFFGIQLSIKEWAKVSKKLSIVTTSLAAIGVIVLASSVYVATHGSCTLPGACRTAGVYGARLTYPSAWSARESQFFVSRTTSASGLIVSSPTSTIRVAIAAKYTGEMGAMAAGIQGKLVSQEAVPHLKNANVIKWIQYDDTTKTYVALENIVSTDQLKQLGFVMGKFTPLATSPQLLFKTSGSNRELNAGFNSQGPLSLEQASVWFNGKDVITAHKVLLSLSADSV